MNIQKLISYFLHPIIYPLVGTILYFIYFPKNLTYYQKMVVLITIFIGSYVLPILTLFFMKKVKMIKDFYLEDIQERKFPLVFFITLSFLLGSMLYKTRIVDELSLYFFGSTIALGVAYIFLWLNLKISIHTLGAGGLIGLLIILSYTYKLNLLLLIMLIVILSGFIASSRLKLKAHETKEVYIGFLVGVLSQLIILFIYNI